jgi:hypothetical protein
MNQRLEQKKQHRLIALETIYDLMDGRTDGACDSDEFFTKLETLGVSHNDTDAAMTWLSNEGLAKWAASGLIGITHDGVREIEKARDNPEGGTEHFTPVVIRNVNHFHGAVGGFQQGSNNSMHVAQQFNAPAAIIDHFAAIRKEVEQLPEPKKADAIELVEAMEAEAKKPEPKHVIFASYAMALAQLVTSVAPHIPPLLDWISRLKK